MAITGYTNCIVYDICIYLCVIIILLYGSEIGDTRKHLEERKTENGKLIEK